jgi:branched-chain amino acid transport system permease protein
MEVIQQLLNGLSLGSMYALIAIGYTMVYGVLRLINFAHGDIMMVGAFSAFVVYLVSGSFTLAIILSILVASTIGILTYKIAYSPLIKKDAPKISLLITAIGISFFLENLFNMIFGGVSKAFNYPKFFDNTITFFGAITTVSAILITIITILVLLLVVYFLNKTKYGIAIKALAFDISTVSLMGINVSFLIAIVFFIGSSLASLGGVFYAISYPSIDPLMGVLIGLKAFSAAVLGGIGSVAGAAVGGFILGFSEVFVVAFFPEMSGYKDAIAFIFLIFILLFKPSGIMGINFERSRF